MAMKAFGILLTATVAFASPNESRRQLQEGPCADLDADGYRRGRRQRKDILTFSGIERPRRLRLGIIHLRRGDGECR